MNDFGKGLVTLHCEGEKYHPLRFFFYRAKNIFTVFFFLFNADFCKLVIASLMYDFVN